MATLNISLPEEMRQWIAAQVSTGEYANASDYMRDLIRYDQRQRDAVALALIEAEQGGLSSRSVAEIIAATKATLKHD